ncbi:MAG: hypothetical protein WCG78_01840 [Candidatus Omnitrophota bacterium]
MKKLLTVMVAVAAIVSFTTCGFAKQVAVKASADVVKGVITSIDTAKNEIVVKNEKTGVEKTVVADAALLTGLTVGEKVKATLKAGKAVEINKVLPKAAKAKK